jgi:hypothetical protein
MARLGNNQLAFLGGRLSMAKAHKDTSRIFMESVLVDIRKEMAALAAALEAYEAAPDPDVVPVSAETEEAA